MDDPLDARLPIMYGGTSIALRDTYTAADTVWVPLEYGGIRCKANALGALPAHARIPLLYGGQSLSPADVTAAQAGGLDLLSLEDGSGSWEWEDGNRIEWPGEAGVP
jgi:hypothetical protein